MIPARQPHPQRCHICGAEMSHTNPEVCKNFHVQKAHTSAPAPEPLEKFVLHLVHINQKLDETKRILKTYQRGDLTTEEEDDASELRGFRDALEWALIPDSKTTLAEHDAQVAKAERDREQPFIDFAKSASLKHSEMVDLMRRNNLKIDDLEDPMQKLAFTFFSEIGEMSHEAEVIIDESLRAQQEPQQ